MKHSELREYLLYGYATTLKKDEFNELKKTLISLENDNAKSDIKGFSTDLKEKIPQLNILQDYYVRGKLKGIENNTNVIKNIAIFALVLMIISLIASLISVSAVL